MGSAFKNRGVQAMLDGVVSYLPNPKEVRNFGLLVNEDEKEEELKSDASEPVVALAFKLEDGKYGQLTYVRVYQGTLKRGDFVRNVNSGERVKLGRLVRMHSEKMEDIDSAGPGEICAMFGVDCASGDSFCADKMERPVALSSMFVPSPVVSLAIKPKKTEKNDAFSRALARFSREDPTFQITTDVESKETIISGMGELHLDIYVERLKREYDCETVVGMPRVAYRETLNAKAEFNYLHKKQTGGSGQYGRVIGYVEPMSEEETQENEGKNFLFVNNLVGNNIPPDYVGAISKGFEEAMEKGPLSGHPVCGVKVSGAYIHDTHM